MASQCQRPGCNRPAKNKYCSRACSQKRNVPLHEIQEVRQFDAVPHDVVKYMYDRLGDRARVVLAAMSEIQLESPSPTLSSLSGGRSWGDWDIGIRYSGRDYKPLDDFSYAQVKWMNEIGLCQFIKLMKLAPAIAPYRDDNGWAMVSPDKELADVTTAAIKNLLPRFANDFGNTSMETGHAPFEQTYTRRNKYQLGLSASRASGTEFIVPDLPRSINPNRIKWIDRDKKTGEFMGFTIEQQGMPNNELHLSRREALIITYGEHYRNLFGTSFYESMYPLAAMYEVAMRGMMRYIDRVATPVVVGEGPHDMNVKVPVNGGMQEMSGMEAALLAAIQASISNAIVVPSAVDPETKEKLFKIYYLEAKGTGLQSFVDGLEHIAQDMFRAGMAADRALTQSSGGVGSYNIGEIHQNFTLVHSDMILTQWNWALNQYWIPYISEYNRGTNGPPLTLVVQLLDPRRREAFANMINASRDHPAFKELGYWTDWEQFARTNNVPMRSKKDRDAIIDEILKRNEQMMPQMINGADNQNGDDKQDDNGKTNPAQKAAKQVKTVAERFQNGTAPIFLSDREWVELQKRVIVR